MSEEEKKWCPFMFTPARESYVYIGDGQFRVDQIPEESHECGISRCMAWREIDHNDWDCALIRNGKK
jgi:hypothetical protein